MEEEVELVVVDPVTGAGDFDQAAVGDGLVARVFFGEREEAFEPPEKKRGTRNLAQDFHGVCHVVAVRGNGARIVIEFPKQGAV